MQAAQTIPRAVFFDQWKDAAIAKPMFGFRLRESKTLYADRRRAKQRRERNQSIRAGNLTPDPIIDKDWQKKEDEKYYRLVKGLPG